MTDIAREAGCSQTTVSFVLNNVEDIRLSPETRQKVLEVARRLGYTSPRRPAEPKPPQEAGFVGFIVDNLSTSPEAVQAIEGLSQALRPSGLTVLVAQTYGSHDAEAQLVAHFAAQRVKALVLMTIFTRELIVPQGLREFDAPVVLINCYSTEADFPAVVPGEVAGGQRATRHLIDKGHRRIATITGEAWMEAAGDRPKGYRRALSTADIPFDPDLVFEGDWSASAGYEATRRILALPDMPTAIFCQNDRMAIGCFEALKEAGLDIPRDMSVMGYDDEEIARHLHPQLTTVVLPHRAMGQWAAEMVLNGQDIDSPPVLLTRLECALVQRSSVASPRR
ncbi:LacI family transcriptional regulator [Devosia geojensis]|uniref:LacI family transcriptional regulator n=1 Tax=Devosia geojensis TaxID=443610 RepID=A0A0F5FEA2_9HYPH|nr:LacI family DNA-binding transcriptional regulator [Devosia geojensis]KKB07108.1 LacI family transcriptional regulator [Devosia geojensis]